MGIIAIRTSIAMLIVCTQDTTIRQWAQNPASNARKWATLVMCPLGAQPTANTEIVDAIKGLAPNDIVCFSAHGNDSEIGDSSDKGWTWTIKDIVQIFSANKNFSGQILISACATQVVNFSARLAVAMQNAKICNNTFVYGYNKPLSTEAIFPDPNGLSKSAELQGTQVVY